MAQITCKDKINQNKKINDGKIQVNLRKILHPIMLGLASTKVKYKIVKENKFIGVANRPIIFAVNHSNSQDIPIACKAIKKHGYLLIGKQPLEFLDELFFKLNGVVFVDRKDKEDTKLSKDAMVSYLKNGVNMIMFPEGTWNMTDQQLIMNMKWGIIDIAKESNAQIIPVILDYDKNKKKCHVKFGDSMLVDEKTNKKDAIEELRDRMASLRWSFIDESILHKREDLDIDALRKGIHDEIYEYPKLDYEYEKSVVYNPVPPAEEVFAPIKKLGIRKNTAFMYGKSKKGNW